jgi:hypothetical protein
MKIFACLIFVPVVLATSPAAAKDKKPTSIELSGDFIVKATIDEIPVIFRVDAATPDRPVLNPEFVERAKLGGSVIGGRFKIGPINIAATTKVIKYDFDGIEWKRRSVWADRAYADQYDGAVGPGGIPYDIITFNLRPAGIAEQELIFPLVENGNTGVEMEVGDKIIDISFTQKRSRTLATAAAGAVIAEQHGGAFKGASEVTEIAFGVERPIRALVLSQPLNILGRPINSLFVRTKDHGDSSAIAEGDNPDDGVDSSEIVVTGKKGKSDKNRYSITLGRDDLSHCSSIIYDKPAKEVRLSCAVQDISGSAPASAKDALPIVN